MKTIRFSVAGDHSLADLNEILSDQEARNSEFLESKIEYEDGAVVNVVTFELYDDATIPKDLILKKKTQKAPDNAKAFWEGVFVVENELLVAVAYRAR